MLHVDRVTEAPLGDEIGEVGLQVGEVRHRRGVVVAQGQERRVRSDDAAVIGRGRWHVRSVAAAWESRGW